MRSEMHERLKTEITRKQFLQYLTAALLMVFGLDNLIALLTGHRPQQKLLMPLQDSNGHHGFGSSRFGV